MKRIVVGLLTLVFCLAGTLALAAADQWVVIKDKNGVCKVISAKGETPKTIAGPFSSKAKAVAAKERKCPQKAGVADKKKKKKTGSLLDKIKSKVKTREKAKAAKKDATKARSKAKSKSKAKAKDKPKKKAKKGAEKSKSKSKSKTKSKKDKDKKTK